MALLNVMLVKWPICLSFRGLQSQAVDEGHVRDCVMLYYDEPPTVMSRKTLLGISNLRSEPGVKALTMGFHSLGA